MSKRVAILQSNYIPWKGYFDLIAAVDEFILYDDMQYTKNDWRNRNLIKTPQGVHWLTIPVKLSGRFGQTIRDVEVQNADWQEKHWKTLCQSYRRAPCFSEISAWLEPLYLSRQYSHLSDINRCFIEATCAFLGIKTRISSSASFQLSAGKSERVADLCLSAGGTEYISGPAAKDYIDETVFRDRSIKLKWFSYSGYPVYPQLWGEFDHAVSILDLLFNCGSEAPAFMKYVEKRMV